MPSDAVNGDETQEPTLRHGDLSVDGWVEYLQELLNFHFLPFGFEPLDVDGDFRDETHVGVVWFQQQFGLLVDGIVGNQTWAALRQERPQEPGTDGRRAGTHVELGLEARWFTEDESASYFFEDDRLDLEAVNTGTAPIDHASFQLPTVTLVNRGQSHVLALHRFHHLAGRAEPGDRFSVVHDRISVLIDDLDPFGLTVHAAMSPEFGGDVLDSEVLVRAPRPKPVHNIVTDGATLVCPFGSAPARLTILPRLEDDGFAHTTATVDDTTPIVNIAPFAMCASPANPEVAGLSEETGTLTPVPCMPAISTPWIPGSSALLVDGQPVLTADSSCMCMWNGPITILMPGTSTSIQDR